MIKLYYHPISSYSRRVVIALAEKQIPYEPMVLDMPNRAHRGPDYLALNPYGRVPAILDGDLVLYESASILAYLEALHPEPALLPADPKLRARVDMHIRLCDAQMARPTGVIIFPKRFLPRDRWDEAAMAKAKEEIEKHLQIIERQLGGAHYLVADSFSLADLSYIPFLQFLPLMDIAPPAAVAAWAERLLARPSAQASVPTR